jgi:hypothetical protein
MQLPYSLVRRGLLALMDEEEKQRGLFGLFGGNSREDERAPSNDGRDDLDTPPVQGATEDHEPGYLQRQLTGALHQILTNPLGIRALTRNPETGEINFAPYLKSVGDRYSETASALPFPVAAPPPRPGAPARAVTLPQSASGFLFGGPQATTAENQVYRLPPDDDRGEGEDCEGQLREEEAECWHNWGSVFGKKHHSYTGCKERAKIRADLCRRGIEERPWRWSDVDVDGWRRPPGPKGRKR